MNMRTTRNITGQLVRILACTLASAGCDQAAQSPAASAQPAAAPAAAPAAPAASPTAELTFTTRSPLSDPKAMAARFKLAAVPTDDYTLAEQPFLVFVPPSYRSTKPLGLIVLVNYKASDALPSSIFDQLEAANLALIVPRKFSDAWWIRAGLALDAVHNLQQRYRIDPRRVYVVGGGEMAEPKGEPGAVAQRLGLFYPDVFTGTIATDVLFYRRTPTASGNGFWNARMPLPDAQWLTMTKARPLIIAPQTDALFLRAIERAYRDDGFKHVELRVLTGEQYHYPAYTTDWLPGMVAFLDGATKDLPLPTTRAPTMATTRGTPTATAAARSSTSRPATAPATRPAR